tara:strand:+ start:804 stop:1010 length:207 start_codon:yes stop_codon:yes gene_type:complete
MNKEKIRELLHVPEGTRIGQHIFNANRDLQVGHMVTVTVGNEKKESMGHGVDIFNLSDEDFISKISTS